MPFLAFEGLDGSGKSTLIQKLNSEAEARGLATLLTREPGGTVLGDELRDLLLKTSGEPPVPRAEALLYQAGRAQHVELVLKPALLANKWILCDRYAASSVAFQGGGRDLTRAHIDWLNSFSTADLKPDLYILLDLSVEESERRLKTRGAAADRFEQEQKDFHQRVRSTYLSLAKEDPKRWMILAASEPADALFAQLLTELKQRGWF